MRRQRNMSHDYPMLKLWSNLYSHADLSCVGRIYMIQGFDQPADSNYTVLSTGIFKDYSDENLSDNLDPTRVLAGDAQGNLYIYDYNNLCVFKEKISEYISLFRFWFL